MIHLYSDDLIEMFSHSKRVAQNAAGTYMIPGNPRHGGPSVSLFFISEKGTSPIRAAIDEARDLIRAGNTQNPGPAALNLAGMLPVAFSTAFWDMEGLAFAVLLPDGFDVRIPERHLLGMFSRILQGLSFSRRAWG